MEPCSLADQGNIVDLVGCDLVSRNLQAFQEVYGSKIKGGGKTFQPQLCSLFHKLWLPFPGGISLLVQFVFRQTVPEAAFVHAGGLGIS